MTQQCYIAACSLSLHKNYPHFKKHTGLVQDEAPETISIIKRDKNLPTFCLKMGYAVAQLAEAVLQTGRSRVRFSMVSLEFFLDIILQVELLL